MFSKACEYGIRASTYIALKSLEGTRVSLKEIAEKLGISVKTVENQISKALRILRKVLNK